ncbi:MAG: hypothetical protein VX951_14235, partial [Planctomycetota bacterium]|nr:hypothetical protein [Planctomycetota bacterium]
ILTTLVAFLPLPAFWYLGELAALFAYLGSARLLWVLVRPATARPRWPFLLHAVLFVASVILMIPVIQRDPIRDQIGAVAAAVGPDATVVFLVKTPNDHSMWVRYFPGAQEPDVRAFNPFVVDYLVADKVAPMLKDFRRRVDAQAAQSGPVFLVEESVIGAAPSRYQNQMKKFLADLKRDFSFHSTAVPRLFRLKKRVP